jgi:hypothetical protein
MRSSYPQITPIVADEAGSLAAGTQSPGEKPIIDFVRDASCPSWINLFVVSFS